MTVEASAVTLPPLPANPAGTVPLAAVSARDSALQLLAWARDNGLLSEDAYYPKNLLQHPNFGQSVDSLAISALRKRQIRFVAIDEDGGKISVFLKRAAPTENEMKSLPHLCNGHQVSYHQGNSENVSPSAVAATTNTCALHASTSGIFYTCGSSISIGNNREAGTLGCLVKDAQGAIFGLTNNHVSGACGYAQIGLPVLAPGVLDVAPGNPHPFTIGTHFIQLPMIFGDPSGVDHTLNSDAALIKITKPEAVSSMQRGAYDTPLSVIDLVPGMAVEKVGRTTGHTAGAVLAEIVGATSVSYAAGQYNFAGSAYFEKIFVVHGFGDLFSDGGDSGSLVTHLDTNGVRHAVGIVFAGTVDGRAPGGKRSLIMPIKPILERLQVSMVSGYNL
ncbi:S1 family peptidase [Comamonas squillarum]|uniref:S1 family peptidase n=1 Tax=Comamonas squillarum TaxID=2977320 RepID=A0ABY6A1J9_9BURK|nr:S1 family peptidase [Comamonas sp. PR12]UXC20006.1 S1 family peptidase [Comamonas sp. PR12]